MKNIILNLLPIRIADHLINLASNDSKRLDKLIFSSDPSFLIKYSKRKAIYTYNKAKDKISFYGQYLKEHMKNYDIRIDMSNFDEEIPENLIQPGLSLVWVHLPKQPDISHGADHRFLYQVIRPIQIMYQAEGKTLQ